MSRLVLICVAGTVIGGATRVAFPATTFSFSEILRTGDATPDGMSSYQSFGAPAFDGDDLAFRAVASGVPGIYARINGVFLNAADGSVPNGSTFVDFDHRVSLRDGILAFESAAPDPGHQNGVYLAGTGGITDVANFFTPVPDGTGSFTVFESLSFDGVSAVFFGVDSAGRDGIYIGYGSGVDVVANHATAVPGGAGTFTGVGPLPVISGGNVVFTANEEVAPGVFEQAIYSSTGGVITRVVTDGDTVPGIGGTFDGFGALAAWENDVAFRGNTTTATHAVFKIEDNLLSLLFDPASLLLAIPDAVNPRVDVISFDNGKLAFDLEIRDVNGVLLHNAIYSDVGGSLTKVIGRGDVLDGQVIRNVDFSRQGLSDGRVAFRVIWGPASESIYLATPVNPVPEPASLAIWSALGLSGWAVARNRRCRRSAA